MARNVQITDRRISPADNSRNNHSAPSKNTASARQSAGTMKTKKSPSGSMESQHMRDAENASKYGYTPREWRRINEEERLQKKKQRRLIFVLILLLAAALFLMYCVWYVIFRSHDTELSVPFSIESCSAAQNVKDSACADGMSADLCVTDSNVNENQLSLGCLGAGLFDLTDLQVDYAKDVFVTRSPASLTKIMTALVALKYGNLDDEVTVTDTVLDIEYGSSVCDIKTGDQLTLKQLLYGMMIASGNDAAMMIAEHVGGSVDNFVAMMNQEALNLGATRTHFVNPHGLTDSDHYTCVYDLYLIFHEAMNYDIFMDIINRTNYYAEYKDASGNAVAVTWESTNHYFTGEASQPDNVTVYGGKTGTTEDAGACLCLLAKNDYGNPYLAIILHASDKESLYQEMNELLSLAA